MNYCPSCGQKIQEGMKFCHNCGQKLVDVGGELGKKETLAENTDFRSSRLVIERAEPTYYSDKKGVRITSTRLITPGKTRDEGPTTYSMANITSVKTEKREPKRVIGVLIALSGFVLGYIGYASSETGLLVSGVVIAGAGIALTVLLKPTYHLKVSSASGETEPLISNDKEYIGHITTAINEALIKRG